MENTRPKLIEKETIPLQGKTLDDIQFEASKFETVDVIIKPREKQVVLFYVKK